MRFELWRHWNLRTRTSNSFEVPPTFGTLGIYLFANSEVDSANTSASVARHLHPAVLYIGKSDHVERRLEKTHKGVEAYRKEFDDPHCSGLRFSTWYSPWTNTEISVIGKATVALCERLLLLEYVTRYGRYPKLNRV